MSELLDDPLVCLLMARDGITRNEVENLMAAMRARSLDHNERNDFHRLQSVIRDSAFATRH